MIKSTNIWNNSKILWLLSLVTAVILTGIGINADTLYGGADSYQHYLIAKYAFKHDHLLLYQWGKPFFTLLAAPFAILIGAKGMVFYNVLMLVITGVLSFNIAKRLGYQFPLLAFILVCYMPWCFTLSLSGFSAITGALVISASINLYLKGKLTWASILISFLPFTVTYGYIPILLIVIYYVVKKHYRYIGLLFTATLLYAYAGFVKGGNVLWLWVEHPYDMLPNEVLSIDEALVMYTPLIVLSLVLVFKKLGTSLAKNLGLVISIGLTTYSITSADFKRSYNPNELMQIELAKWLTEGDHLPSDSNKLYLDLPFLSCQLDINPFDDGKVKSLSEYHDHKINTGDVLIWSDWSNKHYSAISLVELRDSDKFEELKSIEGNRQSDRIVIFKKK